MGRAVTGDVTAPLVAMLRARSGFAPDAVAPARVASYVAVRTRELGLAGEADAVTRILSDETEYARLESHFAPSETWLFRYAESFEHLRAFARARGPRGVRALVAGAGGWCEPCSVAAALLDGAGEASAHRIAIEASDRNGTVFARGASFRGMDRRGGVPAFASRFFAEHGDALDARPELVRAITPRARSVEAEIEAARRSGARFDVIAFRNVAIYLDREVRAAIMAGLAACLADDGTLLVGHAEMSQAAAALDAAATGLAPAPSSGAFAFVRVARPAADAGDARRVIGFRPDPTAGPAHE